MIYLFILPIFSQVIHELSSCERIRSFPNFLPPQLVLNRIYRICQWYVASAWRCQINNSAIFNFHKMSFQLPLSASSNIVQEAGMEPTLSDDFVNEDPISAALVEFEGLKATAFKTVGRWNNEFLPNGYFFGFILCITPFFQL